MKSVKIDIKGRAPMGMHREAFGRTIVEAMKPGKPVIGTRSSGAPELARERKTGYLYEPEDAHALVVRFAQLAQNSALTRS